MKKNLKQKNSTKWKYGFDRLFRNGYGLDFRVETMSYPRYVFAAACLYKHLWNQQFKILILFH
jgi:hypothetical protein